MGAGGHGPGATETQRGQMAALEPKDRLERDSTGVSIVELRGAGDAPLPPPPQLNPTPLAVEDAPHVTSTASAPAIVAQEAPAWLRVGATVQHIDKKQLGTVVQTHPLLVKLASGSMLSSSWKAFMGCDDVEEASHGTCYAHGNEGCMSQCLSQVFDILCLTVYVASAYAMVPHPPLVFM
eukprot:TRINITY_DN5547_c0_g1_i1.p1 TRINITY_DN5547_c0_g1~~TRINITY_DN5547_c0_g1_i1.p1  ORF type:complete len:180 (-),score=17.13 TRINITY_DN5547_c0_g1_i1:25-564(-)